MLFNILSFIKTHLIKYPTPLSITYAWSFGALTGIFLTIQVITGVLLGFHYDAGEFAFESIEYIMRDVSYGWLLRYLHSNSASFYFLCMFIHIARGIFYKSYVTPREFAWSSGVFILLLSIVTAFLGYVLPWGQMSYWAATVIIKLLTVLPAVGVDLVTWLWGDFTVASLTLIRFFELHYTFSIILVLLVFWHISYVHATGSSTKHGLLIKKDLGDFGAFFASKDTFIVLVTLFVFLWIVFYYPNWLGHPDNYIKADPLVTPKHIVPEWYFLPFYAILRSFESKFFGVSMLVLSIFVLLCLPLCKEDIKEDTFVFGFKLNWFFYIFVINFICLGYIGSMSAEFPFIQAGKFHTLIYFISIFIFFYFCNMKNRFIRLLTNNTISKINKQTKMYKINFITLYDIIEQFTFMEKVETLKANPYYIEDTIITFLVIFGGLYFFLSSNKYCLKALFHKVFFSVIELYVGDKFNKNLLSYVCIWYFYGLALYIFYNNMQGLFTHATTFATYLQLPLSISFIGFCLAFFVALGEYRFKWLNGFLPFGIPPMIALTLLLIEFLSFCMRLLSLAARLFINILAGHLLFKMFAHSVAYLVMLLYAAYFEGSVFLFILGFLFIFIEYMAAFLQAAVLATLVAIYINDCVNFAQEK
jgi:quinol-cytochrome oxidoreductase complex cytochrome b subunit/F0F1-type ATP synthase membrane subunit a